MSVDKLFTIFENAILEKFDIAEFLDIGEFNDFQKKSIEDATFILKDNIVGEVKKIGGNLSKNKAKFEEFTKKAEEELKDEKYKDSKKDLKDLLKEYTKALKSLIEKTCVAIIPVKEMPWADIVFRSVPRIVVDKKKAKLLDNAIAYYGEIKCVVPRPIIYGKMKEDKPLFAPIQGNLDLGGFKLSEEQEKAKKSQIYPYISVIIESLDAITTKSHLAKYHEGFQRHGDPACDFLMKDDELIGAMEKIASGLESKRLSSDIAICGIAIPLGADNASLILVIDEGKESDSGRFTNCFGGTIRFSAACCEVPSARRDFGQTAQQAQQMTQAAQAGQPSGPGVGALVAPSGQGPAQPGGAVRTPGGQEIKVWTQEELANEAQKRGTGGVPPGMETWDEDALAKVAAERGSGIPEGMEVWTEDDLADLAKQRQGGGLNIPEWKDDGSVLECSKCGYGLRKGWTECPICGTPVGAKPAEQPSPAPSSEQPPEPVKETIPEPEVKPSEPAEEKKDD
jgi:hypothetical protein